MVAEAIASIAASRRPRLRYLIGRQALILGSLKRLLPQGMFEGGARNTFRLDRDG